MSQIRDLTKQEVPIWVGALGGKAAIKNPYSNAGQGVYCVTNAQELAEFMRDDTGEYDNYIVQSLIGDHSWSSSTRAGQFYHVGTVPDKQGRIFCGDLRLMTNFNYTQGCWRPLALYSRRATHPLYRNLDEVPEGVSSWDMLGTNLSLKTPEGAWTTGAFVTI